MTLGSVLEALSDGALCEAIGRELTWPAATRTACLWPFFSWCRECQRWSRVVSHPPDSARSSGDFDREEAKKECEEYLGD